MKKINRFILRHIVESVCFIFFMVCGIIYRHPGTIAIGAVATAAVWVMHMALRFAWQLITYKNDNKAIGELSDEDREKLKRVAFMVSRDMV